jgi:hypothetical protein
MMGYSIPSAAVSRFWFPEAGNNRCSELAVRESWRVTIRSFQFVFMMSTCYESSFMRMFDHLMRCSHRTDRLASVDTLVSVGAS